jgi:hypothetical protein
MHHLITRTAPYLLFAIAALSLSAIGIVRRRRGAPLSIPSDGKTKMMTLMEAAAAAYEAARREGMVIVTVAERAPGRDGAVTWLAQSIAGVIPVYRMSAANAFEKLARPGGASELQSLYIRKQDLQTYVRWARSMQ